MGVAKRLKDAVIEECDRAENMADHEERNQIGRRLWEEYGQGGKACAATVERAEALVNLMCHVALREQKWDSTGYQTAIAYRQLLLAHPQFDQLNPEIQAFQHQYLLEYHLALAAEEQAIAVGRQILAMEYVRLSTRVQFVRTQILGYLFQQNPAQQASLEWIGLIWECVCLQDKRKAKRPPPHTATYVQLIDLLGTTFSSRERDFLLDVMTPFQDKLPCADRRMTDLLLKQRSVT